MAYENSNPPTNPRAENLELLAYIEAAVRTTTRSREILILIIVVSVLVFGAFWNARQGSWIGARLNTLTEAREFRKRQTEAAALPEGSPQRTKIEISLLDDSFDRARQYLALRPPTARDVPTMESTQRKLQEIRTEHVLYLKLPFFGLFIDVNDLGMLGGFTFMVLLLWFRSGLWHERQNLEIIFQENRSVDELRFCYEVLSMQQVLATPPPLTGAEKESSHWSVVVKALLLLPLAIHFTVFLYDALSFDTGWSISSRNTIIGMTVGALFLAIIAWLTYMCFGLTARIAEIWRKTATDLQVETLRRPAG